MTDNKRYYAFDSLRAIMMFLGVVIHSAMSYSSSNDMSWPLRAKDTSAVFLFLVDFIHTFRMPVFFLMAGFFGAFLYYNKGPEQMLKNRARRILIPFLVFLCVLNPFIIYSFKYCNAVFNNETPITLGELFSSPWSYIPIKLFHLWFLYYLFIISALTYLLAKATKRISISPVDHIFEQTFKNPLYRLLALTVISFFLLFLFGAESFKTSISWIPDIQILFYFFAFYITGWFLYRKKEVVYTLKKFDVLTTIFGVMVFCLKLSYDDQMSLTSLQIINSIITCTLSIGIIGLFLRFADVPNPIITYFVHSAYWVYLVHFCIAIWISGIINDLNVSVFIKFLMVLLGTTTICLTTYHFGVRNTFIGVFLNGKKANN